MLTYMYIHAHVQCTTTHIRRSDNGDRFTCPERQILQKKIETGQIKRRGYEERKGTTNTVVQELRFITPWGCQHIDCLHPP